MCCGRPDPAPAPVAESGNRMAKMPDGSWVEVESKADERAKREAVYQQMRDRAKTSWSATPA